MACSPVAVSVAPDTPPLRSASMPRSTASTSTAIWRGFTALSMSPSRWAVAMVSVSSAW